MKLQYKVQQQKKSKENEEKNSSRNNCIFGNKSSISCFFVLPLLGLTGRIALLIG